jgi:hypothetical protein
MHKIVRIARWIAGAIAFILAGRWALEAIRGRRPYYGEDPELGLRIRIAPLSPAERAAALEREADPAASIRG